MTLVVHKFKLPPRLDRPFALELPEGARILSLQAQRGFGTEGPVLWALVNPRSPLGRRIFFWAPTGGEGGDFGRAVYHGTVQLFGGALVLHLFEAPANIVDAPDLAFVKADDWKRAVADVKAERAHHERMQKWKGRAAEPPANAI